MPESSDMNVATHGDVATATPARAAAELVHSCRGPTRLNRAAAALLTALLVRRLV